MSGLKKEKEAQDLLKFSESDKRRIIEDYLQSGSTKRAVWEKHTGRKIEHGSIVRWMRALGYLPKEGEKSVTFAPLKSKKMNPQHPQRGSVSEFEHLQLQRRVLELENQLHESEMKSIAWQTMVEIAEREFNISIKKKYATKPSKR